MYQSFGPVGAFILALGIVGYIVQSRLPPPKPKVIGIDLGTTYSCVGVYNAIYGNVTVFEDNDGHRVVPSVVAFQDDRILVGYSASRQAEENPSNTLYDSKRFMGKIYHKSWMDNFEGLKKSYPFELKVDTEGKPLFGVKANDKLVYKSPEDVGAILLRTLKETAEERLMDKVSKAVISVPAEFNGKQRNATIAAGRKAGLDVLRIINEPTAAAMAYGMHKKSGSSMIIVIDFGGGTLDVSLLSVRGGMFVTLAMAGNNRLGGQDINENLFMYVWHELLAMNCKLTEIKDVQHLRDQVELAKLGLTFSNSTFITVTTRNTNTCPPGDKNGNVKLSISRSKFEEINASLFDKILVPIRRVIKEVEVEVENIDEIILVGGSTRIPKVRQLITDFFGKKPNTEIDPDIAVVTGVAVQAGILSGAWPLQVSAVEIPRNDLRKLDVTTE